MKSFNSIMGNHQNLDQKIQEIKRQVLNDPDVKAFLNAHQSEVTNRMIDEDLNILQEYKDQQKHYDGSHTYENCPNFVKGHIPELYIENQHIKIRYKPCPCKIRHDEEQHAKSMITSFHMHPDTLNAKIKDIYMTRRNRLDLAMRLDDMIDAMIDKRPVKGLYLYGEFGTGKSFILGAIANELKDNRVPSMIIYVPEFIRTLKNGFKDGSTSKRIQQVREARVLFLDDLGAEDMTPWVRDEVLGPILHYRMIQELPTFFSSNMSLQELEDHLATTKNGTDVMKAKRIMERVKTLSEAYLLEGENYRKH
ncbi:primosomal protein DnaI [Staphylococcus schleiferi]|uniref:Primosomal protein DnaI n=1 Tax=Staphylococcus coagulans TaxID=74706 RepID=A0A9X1DR34_9STAP|nr:MULTISPECIES: primosomal protein DnaI [Staphylococcus]AKS66904.1 primosomal protein DnaI [Staphylococcus schleiferi]AKS71231.1 primosomal protein DnaI [Staphylococcus schleiferi]AKS73402.1 primosomal protein DnaI [Staphylococcus schleiferi]MBA8763148.1 primosomal protein DnaI [Staphylococcus coagulans]MBA8771595.1 primosomal protein DnaI [Staphylococcus coagulans]